MSAFTQPETRKINRLDLRVRPEIKKVIEQAAEVLGVSITDFVSATLVAEAQAVLERHHRITLNNADRDRFLLAIDSTEPPNEALIEAARSFNQRYQSEASVV